MSGSRMTGLMLSSPQHRPLRHAHGAVLIVVTWIVLVLAALALVFARAMRVELIASANHVAAMQADSIARAALQYVCSQLDGTDGLASPAAEMSCEAVQVGDGYFWLLAPSLEDDQVYAFGIRDEAARVNLNTATREMLLKLPDMTAEMAAAIVDWRDSDDEVSPGGAESEYYLLLDDPYYSKNAPFETLEELLLVRNASIELLLGEDRNRNGVLDANENDGDAGDPPDDRDGRLDRGLLPYLTVFSREPNQTSAGEARVNVNDPDDRALEQLLEDALDSPRAVEVMALIRGERPFRNLVDFYLRTRLTAAEFAKVADGITASRERVLAGLVNVSTAPREVLLCLPELEEGDVTELLARRGAPDTDLSTIAWVADALPREKAVAIGDLITCRSFQYSVDIVAVSGDGRAFRRYLAVVDAAASAPRVIRWTDLTPLGWPLDPALLADLRAGQAPAASTVIGG